MIFAEEKHLSIVRIILKKYVPNAAIKVFGSRVNGNPKLYSDLDLAIDAKEQISLLTLAKIEHDFEESSLPFRVDVMDWQSISSEIKENILENFELL
ncbi:MAG: nucleotidyltransferase domain-containing protein [Bdellovibrionota bacterium]